MIIENLNFLIICNAQNDYIDRLDGKLGTSHAESVRENILEFLDRRKAEEFPDYDCVILTQDTHSEESYNYNKEYSLRPCHGIFGTWGHDLDGEICAKLSKQGYSRIGENVCIFLAYNFNCPNILKTIQNFIETRDFAHRNKDNVIYKVNIDMMGYFTDVHIVANAFLINSEFPQANVRIIWDGCCGSTINRNLAGIRVLESSGFEIVTLSDIFNYERMTSIGKEESKGE